MFFIDWAIAMMQSLIVFINMFFYGYILHPVADYITMSSRLLEWLGLCHHDRQLQQLLQVTTPPLLYSALCEQIFFYPPKIIRIRKNYQCCEAGRVLELPSNFDSDSTHKSRIAGAALFGWSRSRFFGPAPAPTPTPTLQYCKYFIFTGPLVWL